MIIIGNATAQLAGRTVADDFMLDMALRHFQFDEIQITEIKAAIPKLVYVTNLIKHNKTVLIDLVNVINMVAAQINKETQ